MTSPFPFGADVALIVAWAPRPCSWIKTHGRGAQPRRMRYPRLLPSPSLCQDLRHHVPVVDLQPLAAGHREFPRVESELVEDRGVQVGNVVAVLDGVEADLVGRAVGEPALDAAAGHEYREAERVVIAP